MSTVYLLSAGQRMCKNGGRIEIWKDTREKMYSLTLEDISSVVVGSHTQISTEVIYTLLQNSVQISYIDRSGKLLGCMADNKTSLDRLLMQQRCFVHPKIAAELIRYTIGRKMENQRHLLAYYASSQQNERLKEAAAVIRIYEHKLSYTDAAEDLRGYEGIASRVYFEAFGEIFDSRQWDWSGRNRRPPQDPVNSMLSYGYAFLEREVRVAIAGARLDARIGFLHSNNGRKDSLVFDLLELFRQNVIDKFVLKMINRQLLLPIDFAYDEELGCRFSDAARRKWILYYEKYMLAPRKMLDGMNWRQHIQKEIESFADMIYEKAAHYLQP